MSRLDKLLDLIESAPAAATRRAAALQLGEIISTKPEEICRLLTRLYPYTIHKKLETRTAAGVAVEAMAKNVPTVQCDTSPEIWEINTFDLDNIMNTHKILLAADDGGLKRSKMDVETSGSMSKRQRVMMKRKVKKAQEKERENEETDSTCDFTCDGWPFSKFCEKLLENVFDPKWEVRHGAAICLREVLRAQQKSITEVWAVNVVLKLLAVIALDRFGDFISDNVIAPVRETCAQVIGIAVKHISCVNEFIQIVCKMYHKEEWEVKHGALLVMKYTVAIIDHNDIGQILLTIKPVLLEALADVAHDESVAVAAEVIGELLVDLKDDIELIEHLRELLWGVLEDLDELTASTNNVLQLLERVDHIAAIHSPIKLSTLIDDYIPKLIQFSGHILLSVRTAVMETYHGILTQILQQLTTALPQIPELPNNGKSLEQLFYQCCASIFAEENTFNPVVDDLLSDTSSNFPHNSKLLHCAVSNTGLILTIISHAFPNSVKKDFVGGDAPIATMTLNKERIDVIFNASTIISRILEASRKVQCDAETPLTSTLTTPIRIMLVALAVEKDNQRATTTVKILQELYNTYDYDDINSFDWKTIIDQLRILTKQPHFPTISKGRDLVALLPQLKVSFPGKTSSIENALDNYMIMVNDVVNRTKATLINSISPMITSPSSLHLPIFKEASPLLTEYFTKVFDKLYKNSLDVQCLNDFFELIQNRLKSTYTILTEYQNTTTPPYYSLKLSYSLHYFLKFLATHDIYYPYLSQMVTSLTLCEPPEDPTNSLYYVISIAVLPFLPFGDFHIQHLKYLLTDVKPSHSILIATALCRLVQQHSSLLSPFITQIYPQLTVTSTTLEPVLTIIQEMCQTVAVATILIPVFPILITPFLSVMNSNHTEYIRSLGARCFSLVLRYLPLHVPSPPDLPEYLQKEVQEKKIFVNFLFDGIKSQAISQFAVFDYPINGTLRPYQRDGISWLLFLQKYCINGILCDDMGLGKTLQTLCLLVSVHKTANYPSLIICPPTLTGHWKHEIAQFIHTADLVGVLYSGTAKERLNSLKSLKKNSVLIASYETVRHDLEHFKNKRFTYCVLDEGHLIKNPKTKLTQAVKQIVSLHRLILTGTPIQNNVVELWSLFDFLMPGFLGSEREFSEKYSGPILAAKDSASPEEQERGVLVMERLHRQVLPFILRRLKESVLQDLPPKIVQDYFCDMSDLQKLLYQEFEATNDVKDIVQTDTKQKSHIFQILNYFRRLCVHPMLVLDDKHPMKAKADAYLKEKNLRLDDISNSPKLLALAELLQMCNIGKDGEHRVLIFAQTNVTLELIEKQLFQVQFPYISYCRLDGSVPQNKRTEIVDKFKNDPTVDVLLLTTRVGGLGLNLTAADIVIFMEHDWNPTKDLQAMDRAHRLGQNKVVNVYRLIVRQTLEERIMNLQQFKTKIANTVVTRENETFAGMNPGNFVELFKKEEEKKPEKKHEKGIYSLLDALGDWDEEEYGNEFDLSTFVDKSK
ncbi:SNF2 family protein [Entamoeba marina]